VWATPRSGAVDLPDPVPRDGEQLFDISAQIRDVQDHLSDRIRGALTTPCAAPLAAGRVGPRTTGHHRHDTTSSSERTGSECCHMADTTVQERNKELVRQFVNTMVNDRNPEKAAELIGDRYISHAHGVADGRAAFIRSLHDDFLDPFPHAHVDIKRLIAEDDLVVCHSHLVLDPTDAADRGSAQFDMLRVDETGIVEHWVAWTAIPDTDPVNTNTMF
jgi:predicted SnoaL-like aldol condensation-catalyzing enzyme